MPGILKLTANVPTKVKIRYLDAVGGDYGTQARIKGTFTHANGATEDGMLYVAGSAADAFSELQRAGVIAGPPESLPSTRADKPVNVPTLVSDVVLTSELPAGEKYPRLRAVTGGNGATPPQSAPQAAPAPYVAPQHETGAPPAAAAPAAPQPPRATMHDDYLAIVRFVVANVQPIVPGMTANDVIASAATLFISANRAGR